MIDFLNKIPMELFPEPYFSKDKIPKEIENLNLYASVPWVESTPLPEKVLKNKSIPHQIIYPGTYRLESRQNKLVIDPQLNTRIAVCIDCKVKTATDSEAVVDTDISGRVYDMEAMKLYFKLDVPYDLMSEEKYQWIYLGAGEIRRTDFLYLQKDWGLQVTLGTFFNLSLEKKCTIWGEFKKQEKEKLIFLNRMALVKVVDVVSTPTTK
jgi:hypothetical protein